MHLESWTILGGLLERFNLLKSNVMQLKYLLNNLSVDIDIKLGLVKSFHLTIASQ